MKMPSVTILVTVKNSANTIKDCIDSLLKLNYRNKKIYVTDAYSTDSTWEILRKYGKKIRLERIKANIAKAHNYMLKRCKTEFIALTDADCVVDKNWLKYLINSLKEEGVVATGGMIKTPKNVNKLQKLIGKELEYRFNQFPNYVSRLPTMSLCVSTKLAKKILFDEELDVAQETDWGYRLTKIGKILFVPEAKVYHYHRPSLKGFFKQQFNYGKYGFLLYFRKGHIKKIKGDEISRTIMMLQIATLYIITLSALLSIINNSFIYISLMLISLQIIFYLSVILRISKNMVEIFQFLLLFLFRNIAWCLGVMGGLILSIKN